VNKKDSKSKRSFIDRMKDSGKDFVDGIKDEYQEASKSSESGPSYIEKKKGAVKQAYQDRMESTSRPEEVYYSTMAWFWAMMFTILICFTLFFYGIASPKFFLVGLLALLGMPVLVIWCVIHMIPTIKIFGFTVFDRRQLSLRRQLSVGKEIARFFTREFLQESPEFAFMLFMFVAIFLMALLFAFIPS
jgi:hypothetical protein